MKYIYLLPLLLTCQSLTMCKIRPIDDSKISVVSVSQTGVGSPTTIVGFDIEADSLRIIWNCHASLSLKQRQKQTIVNRPVEDSKVVKYRMSIDQAKTLIKRYGVLSSGLIKSCRGPSRFVSVEEFLSEITNYLQEQRDVASLLIEISDELKPQRPQASIAVTEILSQVAKLGTSAQVPAKLEIPAWGVRGAANILGTLIGSHLVFSIDDSKNPELSKLFKVALGEVEQPIQADMKSLPRSDLKLSEVMKNILTRENTDKDVFEKPPTEPFFKTLPWTPFYLNIDKAFECTPMNDSEVVFTGEYILRKVPDSGYAFVYQTREELGDELYQELRKLVDRTKLVDAEYETDTNTAYDGTSHSGEPKWDEGLLAEAKLKQERAHQPIQMDLKILSKAAWGASSTKIDCPSNREEKISIAVDGVYWGLSANNEDMINFRLKTTGKSLFAGVELTTSGDCRIDRTDRSQMARQTRDQLYFNPTGFKAFAKLYPGCSLLGTAYSRTGPSR